MPKRLPSTCPKCEAANPLRIVYGAPEPATLRSAQLGLIDLGGCILLPNRPDWRCRVCDHSWFYPDERETLNQLLIDARERSRPHPVPPDLIADANGLRHRTWIVGIRAKARLASEAFNSQLRDLAVSFLRGTPFDGLPSPLRLDVAASIRHPRTYLLRVSRSGELTGWDAAADRCSLWALQELTGPIVSLQDVIRDYWPEWPLADRSDAAPPEGGG